MVAPHRRPHADADDSADDPPTAAHSLLRPISPPRKRRREARQITSPWQLTRIRDLPEESNADAVTLHDLLRDPLIAECWEFNYLHDIPFLMDAFDMDVRGLVRVHVVHGFWKREDANRLMLEVSGHGHNSLGNLALLAGVPPCLALVAWVGASAGVF